MEMKGRTYVDGKDIYIAYGVYVVGGGYKELVAYPPLKDVELDDWQEEDGVEADLSAPKLDSRTIQMQFAASGLDNRYLSFIALLGDGAYHTFQIDEIERTYQLRLMQQPSLDYNKTLGKFTLKFADDFPLNDYTYTAPRSSIMKVEDYTIDDVPFTDYGARVLKGALSYIVRQSAVKDALCVNLDAYNGAIYDSGAAVKYKAKEVKIPLLFRAENLTELWKNYDALLFNLTRPNERSLYVADLEQAFPCYYKSCEVDEFYPTDKIWLEITLTLVLTRSFRLDDTDIVLAIESSEVVSDESGESLFDMSKNGTE